MKSDEEYIELSNEFFDNVNPITSDDLRNGLATFLKQNFREIELERDDAKKRMYKMYNAIRDAALNFLLNSNISNEDKELFKECFKYYLNNC